MFYNDSKEESFSLTTSQKNIWNVQTLHPESAISNLGGVGFCDAKYDFKTMEKVIREVISKNDTFWIKFGERSKEPYQYFERPLEINIQEMDLSDYSIDEINEYFTNENRRVLFGNHTYLYKFTIFKYNKDKIGVFAIINHLIFDAWSFPLIMDDIISRYYSYLGNTDNDGVIERVELSYKNYLKSIDYQKLEKKNQKAKQYFEEVYRDQFVLSEISNITMNREDIIGDRLFIDLKDSDKSKLKNYCETNNISLAILFEVALIIYLRRINKTNSLTIGLPTLNRKGKERNILGMFIGMLPMTIHDVSLDSTVLKLQKKIQDEHKNIFKYQNYDIGKITEQLSSNQNYNSGLFDVMFNYQNGKSATASKHNVKTRYYSNGTSEVPLVMMVNERDGNVVEVSYDYQINNLSKNDVYLFHERILYIIRQIVENTQKTVKDFLIYPSEEQAIIDSFSKGKKKKLSNRLLPQLFEQTSERFNSKSASKDSTGSLTYEELNQRANQFSRFLIDKGLMKGDRICVHMNTNLTFMIVFWGILKAGGVYVPVDIEYPRERVDYILQDSSANFFITDGEDKSSKNRENIKVISARSLLSEISSYPMDNPNIPLQGSDPAYILYTSGTTGQPKGVENTHEAILNRIIWMQERLTIDSSDRILQKTSISFDVSVWELILPHVTGAIQILSDLGTVKDTEYIRRLISSEDVTVVHFVPSLLDIFLKGLLPMCIEKIVCSGEVLKSETVVRAQYQNPNIKVFNLYGPTEAAIDVSYYECPDGVSTSSKIPIGKPVYNTELRVVDEYFNDVPIGVAGELIIYGVQVAKGYYGKEELTNEKFGTDKSKGGSRYYKTGDIAAWNTNGELEYFGRIDSQVKIDGVRIEVGEIEAQLRNIEEIQNVVVTMVQLAERSMLVAYYTSMIDLNSQSLRIKLIDKLPKKWIPSLFVKIDEIILNNNGKVDVKKIKEENPIEEPKVENVTPSNPTEENILNIVKEVLGSTTINVLDDLFTFGLDSMKSIKIISELSQLGIQTEVNALYSYPTVRQLVEKGVVISEENSMENLEKYSLLTQEDLQLLDTIPEESIEEKVLNIVKRVLDNPTISVLDDLFIYGLDSMKSIIIISELSQLGIQTEVNALYTYPTVRQLVEKGIVISDDNKKENLESFSLLNQEDIQSLGTALKESE